jgi:hypothetical protein
LAALEVTSEKVSPSVGRVSTRSLDPFKNHGYLEEKTTHMWKKFYFVLREGSLYKYTTEVIPQALPLIFVARVFFEWKVY